MFEATLNTAPQELNRVFIGKFSGYIEPCPVPPFNQYAQDIRRAIRAVKGDFLILIVVGQFLRDEDAKDFLENGKKYGAVQNHPNVREGLIITIDTRKHTFQGFYEVKQTEFRRQFEPPHWIEPEFSNGPMTHFFGPRLVPKIEKVLGV